MSSLARKALRVACLVFACHGVLVLAVEWADYFTTSNSIHSAAFFVEYRLDRPVFEFVNATWVTFWMRGPIAWLFGPSAWGWGPLVTSIGALGFVLFGGLLYSVPTFLLALLFARWQARRNPQRSTAT
jgi:hypothetical protein